MTKRLRLLFSCILMLMLAAGCGTNVSNTLQTNDVGDPAVNNGTPFPGDDALEPTAAPVIGEAKPDEAAQLFHLEWIPERSYSFPAEEPVASVSEDEAAIRGADTQKQEYDAVMGEKMYYCFYFTLSFNPPEKAYMVASSIRIESAETMQPIFEQAGFIEVSPETGSSGEMAYLVCIFLDELMDLYTPKDMIFFTLDGITYELTDIRFQNGLTAPMRKDDGEPEPTASPKPDPDTTSKPSATTSPAETPKPGETPKPADTPKPVDTPKPAVTPSASPAATPKPTPAPSGKAVFKLADEVQRYYAQIGGTNTHTCATTVNGIKDLIGQYYDATVLDWIYESSVETYGITYHGRYQFYTLNNINFQGDSSKDTMDLKWQVPREITPNSIGKVHVAGICQNLYYNGTADTIKKLYTQSFASPQVRYELYATKAKGNDAIVDDYQEVGELLALGGMKDYLVQGLITNDYKYYGIPQPNGNKASQATIEITLPDELKNYQTLYLLVSICPGGLTLNPEMYYYYIYQRQ